MKTKVFDNSSVLFFFLMMVVNISAHAQLSDGISLFDGMENYSEMEKSIQSSVISSAENMNRDRTSISYSSPDSVSSDQQVNDEQLKDIRKVLKAKRKVRDAFAKMERQRARRERFEKISAHWDVTGRFGYMNHMYTNAPDLNGFGLNVALGVNYKFGKDIEKITGDEQDLFFFKLLCGYSMASRNSNMVQAELHSIHIPLSLNYLVHIKRGTSKNGGVRKPIRSSFGVGPYVDFAMMGKNKYSQIPRFNLDMTHRRDVVVGAHVSASMMFPLDDYSIGCYTEYGLGFNERFPGKREHYWSLGLAFNL